MNKIERDQMRSDNGIICIRSAEDRRWNVDGGAGGLYTPEQCPSRQCALVFETNLSAVQHAQV